MKSMMLKIVFTSVLFSVVFNGTLLANNNSTQENSSYDSSDDDRRKIRIGFTAPSTMHRQLLLTEDFNATSGIDWGYDGEYYATEYDDMYWLIEDQLFTIQGTNLVDEYSNFPIGFHTNDDGMNTIKIDDLENISEEFNLFLFDKELEVYHNLRTSDYEFYADAGAYLDRFELVFKDPQEASQSLSVEENELMNFRFHYKSTTSTLVLNNTSNLILKGLSIYNIAGQLIYSYDLSETLTRQEIQFNNQPAQGTYIVLIETEKGTLSKKVLFS